MFYRGDYETKKFVLTYTVKNAVTIHEDIAELYYQFLGDAWESDQKNITVKILLPDNLTAAQLDVVKAWGHGPLDGEVEISEFPDPDQQRFFIFYKTALLPMGFFLESRILLPQDLFFQNLNSRWNQTEIDGEGKPVYPWGDWGFAIGSLSEQKIIQQEESFIEKTRQGNCS